MKTKTLHEKKKYEEMVSLLRNRIIFLENESKGGEKISSEEEDLID